MSRLWLLFLVLWAARGAVAQPAVVMISIDGLRPDYVLQADAHGLKIPNLRRLLREGSYASAVTGVVPTLTYPSHTTLLTGVAPAVHGIHSNQTFDPYRRNYKGWYWHADDIQVSTLWEIVRRAGRVSLNVHWPVSVTAPVSWNLPQYWRAGTPDDRRLLQALATPGLLTDLEAELGPYANGFDAGIEADLTRARFARRLIELKRPALATLYFASLDHAEHATGPFSPSSLAVLERLDALLGDLLATIQTTYGGRATVCVVSDHGFTTTDRALNLALAFRREGLITVDAGGQITDWKAAVWAGLGCAAIVVRDPAVAPQVEALLQRLAADSSNGIERILNSDELKELGGFPEANWLVALKPNYYIDEHLSGELVTPAASDCQGMHGHLPELAEMDSALFVTGPGFRPGHCWGRVDMRSIAPTVAQVLGLRLPAAPLGALR